MKGVAGYLKFTYETRDDFKGLVTNPGYQQGDRDQPDGV